MFTVRRRESTAHPGRGRAGCGMPDDGREPGTATGASHPLAGDGRQGNVVLDVGRRPSSAEGCPRVDHPVTPVRHPRLLAVGARGRPVVQSAILTAISESLFPACIREAREQVRPVGDGSRRHGTTAGIPNLAQIGRIGLEIHGQDGQARDVQDQILQFGNMGQPIARQPCQPQPSISALAVRRHEPAGSAVIPSDRPGLPARRQEGQDFRIHVPQCQSPQPGSVGQKARWRMVEWTPYLIRKSAWGDGLGNSRCAGCPPAMGDHPPPVADATRRAPCARRSHW